MKVGSPNAAIFIGKDYKGLTESRNQIVIYSRSDLRNIPKLEKSLESDDSMIR